MSSLRNSVIKEPRATEIDPLHFVRRKGFGAKRVSVDEHFIELAFEDTIQEDGALRVLL
jgi:hypothetical protein